jgi:hypothetical protein
MSIPLPTGRIPERRDHEHHLGRQGLILRPSRVVFAHIVGIIQTCPQLVNDFGLESVHDFGLVWSSRLSPSWYAVEGDGSQGEKDLFGGSIRPSVSIGS